MRNIVGSRAVKVLRRTATHVVRRNLAGIHDDAPLKIVGHYEADVEVHEEINHEDGACNRPHDTAQRR